LFSSVTDLLTRRESNAKGKRAGLVNPAAAVFRDIGIPLRAIAAAIATPEGSLEGLIFNDLPVGTFPCQNETFLLKSSVTCAIHPLSSAIALNCRTISPVANRGLAP